MGLFDTVIYKKEEYQTKGLENILETYRIENNRLVEDKYHMVKDMKRYKKLSNSKDEGERRLAPFWCMKKVIDKKSVDMNYHGVLRLIRVRDSKDFYFKFTDGTLVDVTEIKEKVK